LVGSNYPLPATPNGKIGNTNLMEGAGSNLEGAGSNSL